MRHYLLLQCVVFLSLRLTTAFAADTLEQFERGASDVEIYAGYEGLGHPVAARTAHGEVMIGFGLADFLSAYFGTALYGNGQLAEGGAALYLGAFATPLDSDHVDLDLVIDFSCDLKNTDGLSVSPGFELNLDIEPDLAFMGFFLAGGSGVYGESPVPTLNTEGDEHSRFHTHFDIPLLLGYYWTVSPGHQLLLTVDSSFEQVFEDDRRFALGNLGVGYNAMLADNLELVTEVFVDLPQGEEHLGVGAIAGLIGTI